MCNYTNTGEYCFEPSLTLMVVTTTNNVREAHEPVETAKQLSVYIEAAALDDRYSQCVFSDCRDELS